MVKFTVFLRKGEEWELQGSVTKLDEEVQCKEIVGNEFRYNFKHNVKLKIKVKKVELPCATLRNRIWKEFINELCEKGRFLTFSERSYYLGKLRERIDVGKNIFDLCCASSYDKEICAVYAEKLMAIGFDVQYNTGRDVFEIEVNNLNDLKIMEKVLNETIGFEGDAFIVEDFNWSKRRKKMNARQFFDKVSDLGKLQKKYFETRDKTVLQKIRAIEKELDAEFLRCQNIVNAKGRTE